MQNEKELIETILNGQINRFEYFIEQYKNLAFSIVRKLCSDSFIAEEIVQESFIIAYKNLNTFTFKSKFSTWFYTIVLNHTYKTLKINRKLNTIPINEKLDFIDNDSFLKPLKDIDQKIRKKIIDTVLNQLNKNERLILTLFYLQEQSLQEITEITKWNIGNIKVILYRARKHFKELLTKQFKNIINE